MKKNFYCNPKMGWEIYNKVLDTIKPLKNEKILDLGCGEGLLGLRMNGYYLEGVDFNKEALNIAKNRNYAKVHFCDLRKKLPFKDNEFDRVISLEVFQYFENPEEVFRELLRISKKEVIISVPNYNYIGIRQMLSKKLRKVFFSTLNKTYFPTNKEFLIKLGGNRPDIRFISSSFGWIRNIFGDRLSSEVLAVYKIK